MLRLLVLAKRKLSGVVCWPERGHGVLVTLWGRRLSGVCVLVGDKSQLVFWWLALARRMLLVPQAAAGASKVLFMFCFGVPVLSFCSWS